MTLLQLQYFRELGKTLHYTKAAEHLHISQPGLSYSISELEKELGSKLFEKKNRKFQLTPAGQVFMQYVEQALDTITTGVDAFHAVVDSTEERVALGYLHSISSSFIPQMIKRFYQENPHSPILFDFVQDLGPNLVQQLKDGVIDLAFCPELDAALESVPVMVQDLFLAVPSSHPLAHRSSVQFEDFAEEKLIMMAKGSTIRRQLEKIYKESGHVPHLSFELQECHSVQQFVTLEMGLAIVPQAPEYRAEGLALVPIADERFKREIYCSWSKARTLSPAVATLRDFIVEHYGSPQ